MYNISLKILRLFPPELAHKITINSLKYAGYRNRENDDPILSQHILGLDFPNPIGLAAGFDKNAEVVKSMFSFGFGFVEIGTVTPKPQKGNIKPRVFRLTEDNAIINSLGFNSKGIENVRKKNNVNWMTILKIALEHNPKQTLGVMKKIHQKDSQISKLYKKIKI